MAARYAERQFAERQNEYFIPGDGISREVIQADICRYLGNDALVRPGTHNGRAGYFIRAYRNLTTEMIADLKADSARWEQEMNRRENMGYSRVTYAASNTYESRQQQQQLPHPQQQGGPSPPTYNAAPVFMEPGFSPAAYGVQNVPYQANSGAYAHSGVYQTTQPGYGQAQVVYATQPQQTYTIPTQTPVSSPGSMDQYTYSIHGSGHPTYTHETTRNPAHTAHTAPRTPYTSSYDPSESDRTVVTTTAPSYPTSSSAGTDRIMETRFAPENYQQDHRSAPARPRQAGERRGGR